MKTTTKQQDAQHSMHVPRYTPPPWNISAAGFDPSSGGFVFVMAKPAIKGDAVGDCRLLGAAPELLGELGELADWVEAIVPQLSPTTRAELIHRITAARAAIAKAEGRS